MATSYANLGGTGDRRRLIKITPSSEFNSVANAHILIDGVTNNTGFYFSGTAAAGVEIIFDFGTDEVIIDEAKLYQSGTESHGTWKWQGWNGSSYVDVGSSFTLGGATTQTITEPSGNTTGYTRYKLIGVSGTTSSSPWLYCIEFKIEQVGNRTNGCAYANTGGTGDRTASITVTSGGSMPISGTLNQSVGGTYGATNPYINNATSTGNYARWDLGSAKLVDEIALWYSGGSYGTWKWRGSTDGVAFTDIGSSFTLAPNANSPCNLDAGRQMNGNSTAYRYIQLECVTGAAYSSDGNFLELEFRITDPPASVIPFSPLEGFVR